MWLSSSNAPAISSAILFTFYSVSWDGVDLNLPSSVATALEDYGWAYHRDPVTHIIPIIYKVFSSYFYGII